jgi:hypothetical protein
MVQILEVMRFNGQRAVAIVIEQEDSGLQASEIDLIANEFQTGILQKISPSRPLE